MAPTSDVDKASTVATSESGESNVWNTVFNVIAAVGNVTLGLILAYGITDFLIRWRQSKANEEARERQMKDEDEKEQRIRRKALAKLAQMDPQMFIDRIVLDKEPDSEEREKAIQFLTIANPEWAKKHSTLLIELLSQQ